MLKVAYGSGVTAEYSTTELHRAVANIITKLNRQGFVDAATELQDGFSCLNGLTDGWAALLDAIDGVIQNHGNTLLANDLTELQKMSSVVKEIVYR